MSAVNILCAIVMGGAFFIALAQNNLKGAAVFAFLSLANLIVGFGERR